MGSLKEIIDTKEFKKELIKAIETGKTTDWGYDGEDEFQYETYDTEMGANSVLKFLKKHV